MKHTLLLSLTLLATPVFAGDAVDDVKKETKEAADATKRLASETKKEFAASVEKKLDALRAELESLRQRAKKQTGEASESLDEQIASLEEKEKVAQTKLSKLKKASGNAWKSFKAGVESAVDDFEKGLKD